MQAGLERFGAFSDILFLKLMDELSQLREQSGTESKIPRHIRWSVFSEMLPRDRLTYVNDVVWPTMNQLYGGIFGHSFPISSPEIFDDIVADLSLLNFSGADADVKGDAFEYFLKNAYQGITIKDLGEYFTPRNIVRMMVSMVDPKIGEKVYDPFCGTGGFLIEAFRYIALRTKLTPELSSILEERTIYGSEITVTARVARMNMILYGDGHSNVVQQDSFAHPKDSKYDVLLTNPPYSQSTRHGNLYGIPSKNGDAIAIQHCLRALNPGGRAAFLVKEDFLTKSGDVGNVREILLNSVKNLTVISLPRRLFEPYTPTKTSIIYFKKDGSRTKAFFFVVRKVGHTLGARKVSRPENDLPKVLEVFDEEELSQIPPTDTAIIPLNEVKNKSNSLWLYDYIDATPQIEEGVLLGQHVERSGNRFRPSDYPDETFSILGVSNTIGVFLNEARLGSDIKQSYIEVMAGDLVYNPHRVNVGSLGLVTEELEGGIVSGIYVVFRPKCPSRLPPEYLYHILKRKPYLQLINAYDSKHGAVRSNLNFEQLSRIKIRLPSPEQLEQFRKVHARYQQANEEMRIAQEELSSVVKI